MEPDRPFASLDELMAALDHDGRDGDEPVGAREHALQCAWLLRQWRPDDVELQLAGLVHDVGHRRHADRRLDHAEASAWLVGVLLGPRVSGLVARHVAAKRWLVSAEPRYLAELTPASIRSLVADGGPMTPTERARFEADPLFADAVLLRRADDAAKEPGRLVPGLDDWRAIAAGWLAEHHAGRVSGW